MASWTATGLVADEIRELEIGSWAPAIRSRWVARGRDGKFYLAYSRINAAGNAGTVRCVCFSVSSAGVVSQNWDHKVCDSTLSYEGWDDPFGFDGQNVAVAIDWNGTTERVLVLAPESSAGVAGLFYTSTASPGTFTAGDTFSNKGDVALALGGFELFGRKDGSDSIHVVYLNADPDHLGDIGTSLQALKHRTASSHSASWSSATDIMGSAETYSGTWTSASCRASNGDIYTFLGVTGSGNRRLELYKWNGSSWSDIGSLLTYNATTKEDFNPHSAVVDLDGNVHVALVDLRVQAGVASGGYHRLRYVKTNSSGVIQSDTLVHEIEFWNTAFQGSFPTLPNYKLLHYRTAQISVDANGNPRISAQLRAHPVGLAPTTRTSHSSTDQLWGVEIHWEIVSGSWTYSIPTFRQSVFSPPYNVLTVNTIGIPHDVCVLGKMGVPAAGTLLTDNACTNPAQVGTILLCNTPGLMRRVVVSSDWEPNLERRASNAASGSQSVATNQHLKLYAESKGSGTQTASATVVKSRSAANTANGAQTGTGGKAKGAANTASGSQSVTGTKDPLSKWRIEQTAEGSQSVTVNKVITRAATNTASGEGDTGRAAPATSTASGSQSVITGGSTYVSAANTATGAQAATFDPLEGCETTFVPVPAVTSNPESQQFVTIWAPFSTLAATLNLRRPQLGNVDTVVLAGAVGLSRDGRFMSTMRTPNPKRWSTTFDGLTRKQALEVEAFFLTYRGEEMRYRDHNARLWRAKCLTPDVRATSSGPESWSVSLEWQGTVL